MPSIPWLLVIVLRGKPSRNRSHSRRWLCWTALCLVWLPPATRISPSMSPPPAPSGATAATNAPANAATPATSGATAATNAAASKPKEWPPTVKDVTDAIADCDAKASYHESEATWNRNWDLALGTLGWGSLLTLVGLGIHESMAAAANATANDAAAKAAAAAADAASAATNAAASAAAAAANAAAANATAAAAHAAALHAIDTKPCCAGGLSIFPRRWKGAALIRLTAFSLSLWWLGDWTSATQQHRALQQQYTALGSQARWIHSHGFEGSKAKEGIEEQWKAFRSARATCERTIIQ